MFLGLSDRKIRLLFFSLLISFSTQASDYVPVFTSGTEGYTIFRIPAIIRIPGGDLLAFAEGRVHGGADFGDIDIVMKRSSDGGKTWSALQKITDNDTLQSGNPAPVVDLTDPRYPAGRIFLFYNTGNVSEGEIRKGKGYKQVWYKTSTDGGKTWSEAKDITVKVNKPFKPAVNPLYQFREDWRGYANTPGHAEQFMSGKYKGRIYVAANHSAGDPLPAGADYHAHGYYTDDHGESFHLSDVISFPGSNEASAVALSDGLLMMNIRNQKGDIRERIVAVSSNGGQSWDTTYFDPQLPDPVCEGSIINLTPGKNKPILAFSNAASQKRRDSLTLRISYDQGKTWPSAQLIEAAVTGIKGDATAYSDLVPLGKRRVGVLYERANYSQIVFKTLSF